MTHEQRIAAMAGISAEIIAIEGRRADRLRDLAEAARALADDVEKVARSLRGEAAEDRQVNAVAEAIKAASPGCDFWSHYFAEYVPNANREALIARAAKLEVAR